MKTYKKSTIILSVFIFYLLHYNTINAQCNGGCHMKYDYTAEITTLLPFDTEPCAITVGVKNDIAYFQGDIVLGNINDISIGPNDPVNGVVTNIPQRTWTNSTIPYVIEPGFSTDKINEIHNAASDISVKTNLCVIPRTNETNYVSFVSPIDTVCNSPVGMIGGRQVINLHSLCGFGVAIHEILHAAGVWHEQSRSDRDDHVRINFANIIPQLAFNFNIQPNSRDVGPYDFGSIMHYGPFDFSIDFPNLPTIETINALPEGIELGQRNGLSAGDILTINSLYPTPCGTTTTATCFDGIRNGNETGIDCGGSCPACPTNTCNYTITNLTNCEVQLYWLDGNGVRSGATIPPSGSVVEQINNGDLWSANNKLDGSLLISTFQSTICGGSANIAASLCNNEVQPTCSDNILNQGESNVDCGGPCPACPTNNCNFTITNFTNCEVRLSWWFNGTPSTGAIIPPSSYVTEQISAGVTWTANNTVDGSLLTSTFQSATCGGSANIAASLCNNEVQSSCSSTHTVNGNINNQYEAENYIISPASGNNASVAANAVATFDAGKYIELRPGFIANSGSQFNTFIDGCVSLRQNQSNEILSDEFSFKVYPNPFTKKGFIEFDLKEEQTVSVFITDIIGKKITTLLDNETKETGTHQIVFERKQLPVGIYYCTLIIDGTINTKRLIVSSY